MGNKPILAFGDGELHKVSGKYTWYKKSTNITTEVDVEISSCVEENLVGKKIIGYETGAKTFHEFTCYGHDPLRCYYKLRSNDSYIKYDNVARYDVEKYIISSQSAFNGFEITVYKFYFVNSYVDGCEY